MVRHWEDTSRGTIWLLLTLTPSSGHSRKLLHTVSSTHRHCPSYERYTTESPTDINSQCTDSPAWGRPLPLLFSVVQFHFPKRTCLIARFTVTSFSFSTLTFFFEVSVDVNPLYNRFCSFGLSLKRLEVKLYRQCHLIPVWKKKYNRQPTRTFKTRAGNDTQCWTEPHLSLVCSVLALLPVWCLRTSQSVTCISELLDDRF